MTKLIAYMPTPGALTGAPRRLLTLASALKGLSIQVRIASQSRSALIEAAVEHGLPTLAADSSGVLSLRHGALFGGGLLFRLRVLGALILHNWRFRCLVRREGADAVWIRGSKGIAFAGLGALLSRRPLVWDVDYELPSRGMVRWLHRFGLWAAEVVIFQHRAAAREIFGERLASRYRDKLHAIVPGINLDAVASNSQARTQGLARQGRSLRILQVGTICERKNQRLLVDALHRLDDRDGAPPVEVRLAGGGGDEGYIEKLVEQVTHYGFAGVVQFLGWRDDVHTLMAEADLLVMPSKDEGVPNTVQEAMAIGLPVIVSDAGGMPEIVSHGETGWVLPLDDPDAWASQIDTCRRDPALCRAVGAAAAAYAAAHFTTEKWGREYAEVIRSVVEDGRGR